MQIPLLLRLSDVSILPCIASHTKKETLIGHFDLHTLFQGKDKAKLFPPVERAYIDLTEYVPFVVPIQSNLSSSPQ
jgi:hypothetical protein